MMLPDHPEIVSIQRTGYPSWNQPVDVICDRCGEVVEDEAYTNEDYETLCLDCLLSIHLKED